MRDTLVNVNAPFHPYTVFYRQRHNDIKYSFSINTRQRPYDRLSFTLNHLYVSCVTAAIESVDSLCMPVPAILYWRNTNTHATRPVTRTHARMSCDRRKHKYSHQFARRNEKRNLLFFSIIKNKTCTNYNTHNRSLVRSRLHTESTRIHSVRMPPVWCGTRNARAK